MTVDSPKIREKKEDVSDKPVALLLSLNNDEIVCGDLTILFQLVNMSQR